MTPEQFDLIIDQRFERLNSATIAACRAAIIDGMSAYSAENAHKCGRGTVSRYVNKIHAELAFCEEVAAKARQAASPERCGSCGSSSFSRELWTPASSPPTGVVTSCNTCGDCKVEHWGDVCLLKCWSQT